MASNSAAKDKKAIGSPAQRRMLPSYKCRLFLNLSQVEERTPILAVWLNPLWNKRTGAQGSSRLAHPQPSASWTCTGASVPLSCLRALGHPGSILCLKWSIKLSGGDILLISHTNSPNHHNIKCNVNCYLSLSSPCLTKGVHPPACLAGPRLFWLLLVARVLKVLMSLSLMGQRSRWPTWTTECPARICSRHYVTPSPDMVG